MTDLSYVGTTTIHLEPPDIVRLKAEGDLSAEDMARIFAEITRLTVTQSRYFVLTDISGLGKISPDARKRASEQIDTLRVCGGAAFGATFPQRVLVTLLSRVLSLFGNFADRPLVIVETEAQARAWIEARRRELAAG